MSHHCYEMTNFSCFSRQCNRLEREIHSLKSTETHTSNREKILRTRATNVNDRCNDVWEQIHGDLSNVAEGFSTLLKVSTAYA